MKTSTLNNVEISIVIKNQKTEKNAMTKNQKFERVIEKTTRKHIKKSFFNDVNNNTIKKFFSHLSNHQFCKLSSLKFQFSFHTFYFCHIHI